MKITLTQQECNNVKVCLLMGAKRPETNETEMSALLMLARKFNWVDNPPEEAKEEVEEKAKQVENKNETK